MSNVTRAADPSHLRDRPAGVVRFAAADVNDCGRAEPSAILAARDALAAD